MSIRGIVSHDGSDLENHLTYNAFGRTLATLHPAAIDTIFGYTGQEFDLETGLYYYNHRYYDPTTQQFITQDPISFASGDWNHQRYVGNNAPNATDPDGLEYKPMLPNIPWKVPSDKDDDIHYLPTVRTIVYSRTGGLCRDEIDPTTPRSLGASGAIVQIEQQLAALKQNLVNAFVKQFKHLRDNRNLGQGLSDDDLVSIANHLANAYINAVYEFLNEHPNAAPGAVWPEDWGGVLCHNWAEHLNKKMEFYMQDLHGREHLQLVEIRYLQARKFSILGQENYRKHDWITIVPLFGGINDPDRIDLDPFFDPHMLPVHGLGKKACTFTPHRFMDHPQDGKNPFLPEDQWLKKRP